MSEFEKMQSAYKGYKQERHKTAKKNMDEIVQEAVDIAHNYYLEQTKHLLEDDPQGRGVGLFTQDCGGPGYVIFEGIKGNTTLGKAITRLYGDKNAVRHEVLKGAPRWTIQCMSPSVKALNRFVKELENRGVDTKGMYAMPGRVD